jgi:hypothetical protein
MAVPHLPWLSWTLRGHIGTILCVATVPYEAKKCITTVAVKGMLS